jgi:hypothetical protein
VEVWWDSRSGAGLLFQVFADRYERASLLITSNLAFSDWGQMFQGERMKTPGVPAAFGWPGGRFLFWAACGHARSGLA